MIALLTYGFFVTTIYGLKNPLMYSFIYRGFLAYDFSCMILLYYESNYRSAKGLDSTAFLAWSLLTWVYISVVDILS